MSSHRYRYIPPAVSRTMNRCLCLAASFLLVAPDLAQAETERPNILFIAVDDLRPELGCYGAAHIKTPHIDRLATQGRLFTRAYCQQAVCNPSRTSLLTGKRPNSIGVTGNHTHFRAKHPDVVTLPEHFKNHGYHSSAIGKIYHGVFPAGSSKTVWDTMGDPQSWSEPAVRFGPRYYYTETGIQSAKQAYLQAYKPQSAGEQDWTRKLVFGLSTEAPDVADNTLYDGKVADAAIARIQQYAADGSQTSSSKPPFFLAVGFIKPHSPYIAPKKYFDLYNIQKIKTDLPEFPIDAPQYAGHNSGELRRYSDQPSRGAIPVSKQQEVRHAYYACVSYIDAQIGRVLDALESSGLKENTIVVLFGDHGYHLGEHGLWGKTTNFELDTRVPLIIRTPNMVSPGVSTESIVELLDLYPTLADLAGLPMPAQLEGLSCREILDNPHEVTKDYALSQFPRSRGLMGYSMRSATHRFTQWLDTSTQQVRDTELYSYVDGDQIETENLAATNTKLVAKYSPLLLQLNGIEATKRLASHDKDAAAGTNDSKPAYSFEAAPVGRFDNLKTPLGKWNSESGIASIDGKHSKSGRNCLHLHGGPKSVVTLELNKPTGPGDQLTFWAERWTKRSPFRFRVEYEHEDQWRELYSGDQNIRVGRAFLSNVSIPLVTAIKKLRFTVSSPPDTGILIDDIQFRAAQPQEIVNVESVPFTLPALVGVNQSPLLKLKILTKGQLNPISLASVAAELDGCGSLAAVDCVRGSGRFSQANIALVDPQAISGVASRQRFEFKFSPVNGQLQDGENFVWVTGKLKSNASLDDSLSGQFLSVSFSNGRTYKVTSNRASQRIGVAVRKAGDDQVHTYRIPGLATTTAGTLIGVYDVRRGGGGDLPGNIDVGMSRSTDGGQTWEPMRVIMDMGDDPAWRYDGIGDPAVLVDKTNGNIWVAATWSHGNRSWVGSGPGLAPEETGQLMLVKSSDDGLTWSKPINITSQVKKPEWCFILQGPGKGITMHDGTLVFAAQYQDPPNASNKTAHRLPHSTIIYSKDHGNTWQVGTGAFDDTTEAQVVEISPGKLMLNCRYNRKPVRVVMTTTDLGKTWLRHPSSERALIEPRACMGSLIRVQPGKSKPTWLLFSNPNSTTGRDHLTIKASPDDGLTWPKSFRVLLDEQRSAGYSCMSMIDADHLGILYEGSQAHMTFQKIPLRDITNGLSPKQALETSSKPLQTNAKDSKRHLRLSRVFGKHMVLQANKEITIWGDAKPNSRVKVALGEVRTATDASDTGKWRVTFPARQPSFSPVHLAVASEDETLNLDDILVGEVWLCAGQSNMEWPLRLSNGGSSEIQNASNSRVRLFQFTGTAKGSSGSFVPEQLAGLTKDRFCQGEWKLAGPKSAKDFSAVAWYFGNHVQQKLGVPVGLICTAMGGTPTEAWIPQAALASDDQLRTMVSKYWLDNPLLGEFCRTRGEQNLLKAIQDGEFIAGDRLGPNHPFKPGFMWSAAIEPLIPFAFRGVVWYQGESNAETLDRVRQHNRLFPLLISQWRSQCKQGDFPFLYAQLPAMNRPAWPWFRESQRRMLSDMENVHMAVTIDTGEANNVHPREKKTVGMRLANLATTEGIARRQAGGPSLTEVTVEGRDLILTFDGAQSGLKSSDAQALRHFEVCGDDGMFFPATAEISELSNPNSANLIKVSSPEVESPKYVRYAWSPFPTPPVNFCNGEGQPASPFSTQQDKELFQQNVRRQSPNVLLIVSEDNSEHLGCYGEKRVHTPNLDALAAGGIRYTRAYVPYSVCSPSRAAFLTGLYPRQTGHIGLATHKFAMARDFATMPAYFQNAGYFTGYLGKTHINPEHLVERFVDHRAIRGSNFNKAIGIQTYAEEAGNVMHQAKTQNKPFFLVINYADAHRQFVEQSRHGFPTKSAEIPERSFPWIGSDSAHLRQEIRNYFNCMNRLDEGVGMVLSKLSEMDVRDNTLVIYISDHGADFPRAKGSVYEHGTRIPMIINYPRSFSQGKVENDFVTTLDLLPTTLRAAGIPIPPELPGFALQDIDQRRAQPRKYIHTFTTGSSPNLLYVQFAIRGERFKLIYNPDRSLNRLAKSRYENSRLPPEQHVASFLRPPIYELYDLQEDPNEWNNLAENDEHQEIKNQLVEEMRIFQESISDPFAKPENLWSFIEEQKQYQNQPYKFAGFRWPHLKLFATNPNSQATAPTSLAP